MRIANIVGVAAVVPVGEDIVGVGAAVPVGEDIVGVAAVVLVLSCLTSGLCLRRMVQLSRQPNSFCFLQGTTS